jgi:hypothetical protein
MGEFFTWYTFLAFVLGVLLATTVKQLVSKVRGNLG